MSYALRDWLRYMLPLHLKSVWCRFRGHHWNRDTYTPYYRSCVRCKWTQYRGHWVRP